MEKLVSYLPTESFQILDNYFQNYQPKERILHQKGFYPYSYSDSFDKFNENQLPPINYWTNSLNGNEIFLNETEHTHAEKVFVTFGCQTLDDYHNLYLKTDTFCLLHYFTSSHLSGDAIIKFCRADLHFLTEREHLETAENMIRGGVASIISKRFFRANNKYMNSFNPDNESSFGLLLDANNLYGGVMEKLPLPLKDFQKVEIPHREILNTDIDSDVGYILEVDLEYPDYLHDQHKDFPLAPTKENTEKKFLSDFQFNLLEKMGVKKLNHQKLMQTLNNKSNYTVHYLNSKLYVELGLIVKKVSSITLVTPIHFAQNRE